jgi:hypothetical protein
MWREYELNRTFISFQSSYVVYTWLKVWTNRDLSKEILYKPRAISKFFLATRQAYNFDLLSIGSTIIRLDGLGN